MKNIMIGLLALILIIACDQKEGLTDITNRCEFPDDFISPCFSGIHISGYDEIVIRDIETYQEFQDSIRDDIAYHNCETAELPFIDFEKYTLIGKKTSGGGCSADYSREIFEDRINKLITYQISVSYSGTCAMLISSWNWALIPRLSNNYTVEFR